MNRRILLVQLPTSNLGAGEKVYPLGLLRLSTTIPQTVDKRVLDMNIVPDPSCIKGGPGKLSAGYCSLLVS